MEVTRVRLGSVLEWAIAAACILATLGVGSVIVRELRSVPAVTPVIAVEAPIPESPPVTPPRAVSVPMLLLGGGTQLRVGERASAVELKLDPVWQVGSDAFERRPTGARLLRQYDDGTRQFTLVFEPLTGGGDSKLVAIYVQ
jgi:hypothetical protein